MKIRAVTTTAAIAAVLVAGAPVAHAAARPGSSPTFQNRAGPGWAGVVRQSVTIGMDGGWTAAGELDYPAGARGRLPVVVLLHGSGPNDMDQSMPDGKGSTFVPISQAVARRGYAVLRFNKRGVTGVGPVLTDDPAELAPPKPYEQIVRDAASVVRFAARSPRVDPSRIYLLGHSEGTQVAANLAADPASAGIPRPAGVIVMGVIGTAVKELLTYQIFGVKLARLHEEFDVNGDGYLTSREAADGLIGEPATVADAYRKVLLSGTRVSPGTDTDHDGRLAIDSEVGPVFRKATGIDAYPDVPGVDQATRDYLVDIARFPTAAADLARFNRPTLLLNGGSDIQTPARAALVADAAIAATGNPDHKIVIYPGLAHTMNRTAKFTPEYGSPDPAVLADIQQWLGAHR
jgi:dienelactone hydrolase